MREHLYKGKRIDNGEWVYGGIYVDGKKYYIVARTRYIPDTRDWDEAEYYDKHKIYKPTYIECKPETICEYTGLTDNNGTKIFEGDIVKLESGWFTAIFNCIEIKENENYIVFYDEKHARYDLQTEDTDIEFKRVAWGQFINSEVEVIGNIYDNPELLEEK